MPGLLKIRKISDQDQMITQLRNLKETAEAASFAFEEYQRYVIEMVGDAKTARVGNTRMTIVRGTTVKINEAGLKKALGAPLWKKVTKTVLDKPKLEEMVNSGDVDVNTVAQHTMVTPNKAYVRFSTVTDDDTA